MSRTALISLLALTLQSWSSPPADLSQALDLSLRFYGAQRCGHAHNWTMDSSSSCHRRDGETLHRDLSGGWHDAGDYIKWSRTTAWSAYLLLKSMDAFGQAIPDRQSPNYNGLPNGIPDLLDEAKIGTDFLLKILSPDGKNLVSRIGGNQDHDYLTTSPAGSKLPPSQGGDPRPVYENARADVAGISSATLSLMARLYLPYDSAYATKCRTMAQRLWDYALTHPGTTQDNFYPEGDCGGNSWDSSHWEGPFCKGLWTDGDASDALMCAAVERFRTQPSDSLKNLATARVLQTHAHYDDLSWMQFSDPCWHSAVVGGIHQALAPWQASAQNYLNHISSRPEVKGLIYFHSWGSLRIASHAGLSLALLHSVDPQAQWYQAAMGQLQFILGDNPYQRSMITGWGHNPPSHPMHKNAWGLMGDWSQIDRPFELKTPLPGALVGGPKAEATGEFPAGYQDNPRDYVGNEVSIYYNAGLVGLLAWKLSQNSH